MLLNHGYKIIIMVIFFFIILAVDDTDSGWHLSYVYQVTNVHVDEQIKINIQFLKGKKKSFGIVAIVIMIMFR